MNDPNAEPDFGVLERLQAGLPDEGNPSAISAEGHEAAAVLHDGNAARLDRHGAVSDAARERRDAAVQRQSAQDVRERDASPRSQA